MRTEVVIERRFRGPPESANGGYACGVLAAGLEGPRVATLRAPPPLDQPLALAIDGSETRLLDGERLLGEGDGTALELEVPEPPGLEAATEASRGYIGFSEHQFPECFVCGPRRQPGDGLCIFPGPVADSGLVAAPWTPDPSLAGDAGLVDARYVWAALDCPSYFGLGTTPLALLGRLTARIDRLPPLGEPLVSMGWRLGAEGRKHRCASALATAAGEVIARASALWIEIDEVPPV